MNKKEILDKIKSLNTFDKNEKAYLIDLINTKKKYGLVWENKAEDVEEELRIKLPVLKEVDELAIINDSEKEKCPNHILIEGDNLHALTSLSFTHQGKIDAIYLDPPYNTGSKDWKYNNDFVEKEDSFRHSKWISMMSKRLEIARGLLKDDGLICVTIDDYEVPRLTILMEEIFGSDNHLGTIVIRNNPSGRSTVKGVSITHEYGLIFGKSSQSFVGHLPRNEKQRGRYKFEDEVGAFEWVNFRKHGGTRIESPSMFYPIFISKNSLRIPKMTWDDKEKIWVLNEDPKQFEKVSYPIDENGKERRWKWGLDRFKSSLNEFTIRKDKSGENAVYMKARMNSKGVLPQTWWDEKKYSATAYGTNLVKDIFGGELQVFSYPKSLYAVMDTLKVLSGKKDAIIVDAFAGSGTTLHATMILNSEDGGSRQCILNTNNENNIARDITYERNKKIIGGYINSKKELIKGLNKNNLRYYKCDFVPSKRTEQNRRLLTKASVELLCIKENCYSDVTIIIAKLNVNDCRIFKGENKLLIIVFHSRNMNVTIEKLIEFIKTVNTNVEIKVYGFSPEKETLVEEFYEVVDKIEAIPLPDAIYSAYKATFKTLKLHK